MRKLLTISLFSLTLFGSTPAPSPESLQGRIGKIHQAIIAYDLATAESLLEQTCAGPVQLAKTAVCEYEAGTLDSARDDDQQALAHYRESLAAGNADPKTSAATRITTMVELAKTLRRLHRSAEAEQIFSAVLKMLDPTVPPVLRATAFTGAAALADEMNEPVRARESLDQALSILRPLKESAQPELAMALNETGLLELKSGNYNVAESRLRECLTFATSAFGEEHPETASYMTNLALALLVQGQYRGADLLLHRARYLIESHVGKDSPRLIPVLAELGALEQREGKFRIAENDTQRALSILVHRIPYETEEIVLARVSLANIYIRERRMADAETILPAAIEAERGFYKDGRTLADGLRTLAELRVLENQMPDAASLYREAIELYDKALGPQHPDIAPVLRQYAEVLKRNKAPKAERREIEARVHAMQSARPS